MGKWPRDANTILQEHGLRGTESGSAPSTDYRPGTVSDQDPPPNAPIPKNRRVSYWLAEEIPAPVPGPWDWKSFLQNVRRGMDTIGALIAIVVVALIVHWLRRPKVDVVPVKDKDYYGEQHVAPSPLVFAFELCPVLDPGDQELDKVGSLVEQRGG